MSVWKSKAGLTIIVGNYGSGKTEVAVNLACHWAQSGETVSLGDLDLVNPYFRSREVAIPLEDANVNVISPPGDLRDSDLPVLMPQIKSLVDGSRQDRIILDVGGDDVGARVLSSLKEAFGKAPYSLLLVINASRPFTETVAGCLAMKQKIEDASRLKITGIISNTHLMEYTTVATVLDGADLAKQVAAKCGIPLEFMATTKTFANDAQVQSLNLPIVVLDRKMLPPWQQAVGGVQAVNLQGVKDA